MGRLKKKMMPRGSWGIQINLPQINEGPRVDSGSLRAQRSLHTEVVSMQTCSQRQQFFLRWGVMLVITPAELTDLIINLLIYFIIPYCTCSHGEPSAINTVSYKNNHFYFSIHWHHRNREAPFGNGVLVQRPWKYWALRYNRLLIHLEMCKVLKRLFSQMRSRWTCSRMMRKQN